MAKGKPRHKDLPIDERIFERHKMFIRRYYNREMTEEEKTEYLNKLRTRLER